MPRPNERRDDQPGTRAQIVRLLKRWGEGSVATLAAALEVTESAVRQHLTALDQDGMIVYREVGQGPGRRRRLYRTTEAAERLFGDRYEALLLGLLNALDRDTAEQALARLLGEQRARFIASLQQPATGSPLAPVVEILAKWGFLPEVTDGKEGVVTLLLDHCPVWTLARSYDVCCRNEAQMLAEALPGWDVRREGWRHDGRAACSYVFTKAPSRP